MNGINMSNGLTLLNQRCQKTVQFKKLLPSSQVTPAEYSEFDASLDQQAYIDISL
ncbi:hypothetical protein [Lacrimispora sp.]|uniref:hypothetical protein n=1 Tax=Lacrimispora sp. TaxID=2719234 RepID=UPI00289D62DC|nr:hypothetical protein [Lacrimispora sp.]